MNECGSDDIELVPICSAVEICLSCWHIEIDGKLIGSPHILLKRIKFAAAENAPLPLICHAMHRRRWSSPHSQCTVVVEHLAQGQCSADDVHCPFITRLRWRWLIIRSSSPVTGSSRLQLHPESTVASIYHIPCSDAVVCYILGPVAAVYHIPGSVVDVYHIQCTVDVVFNIHRHRCRCLWTPRRWFLDFSIKCVIVGSIDESAKAQERDS